MSGDDNGELRSITTGTALAVLLRALYRVSVDYCAVINDADKAICFSKEQLISLIERRGADVAVGSLHDLTSKGLLNPLSLLSSQLPLTADVLLVSAGGAEVRKVSQLEPHDDEPFPTWWNAPLPFVRIRDDQVDFNEQALLMLGTCCHMLQQKIPAKLVSQDEFLFEVTASRGTLRYIAFKSITDGIFLLEDVSGDEKEASEILQWAAVGKAWAGSLRAEGKSFLFTSLPQDVDEYGLTLRCEWNGEITGYFCVKDDREQRDVPERAANRSQCAAPERVPPQSLHPFTGKVAGLSPISLPEDGDVK